MKGFKNVTWGLKKGTNEGELYEREGIWGWKIEINAKKGDKDRQGVECREAAAENKTAESGFQNSDLLSNHMAEILACL